MPFQLPDTKPAYQTFEVGDDGRVWIKQTMPPESEHADWLIIDPSGPLDAKVRMPRQERNQMVWQGRVCSVGSNTDSRAPYVICYAIDEAP